MPTYPDPGGRITISTRGGTEPSWGPDGLELFYREGRRDVMVVAVTHDQTLSVGQPSVLLRNDDNVYRASAGLYRFYDAFPDGEPFAALRRNTGDQSSVVTESFIVAGSRS